MLNDTMKRMALFLASLAIAAAQQLPTVQSDASALGSLVRIRNGGPMPLHAFIVEIVNYPGTRFRMLQDELTGKPIAPGEQREYDTDAKMPGAVSPEYLQVRAAVYADGTTAGPPEQIASILAARKRNLQATRAILADLTAIEPQPPTAAAATVQLQRWQQSAEPEFRAAAGLAIRQLRSGTVANLIEELKAREKALVSSKPQLP